MLLVQQVSRFAGSYHACRQYIKENPSIKTLKRVKIKVKKATESGAPAAAPAAAAAAGKDKVITPVIDIGMLRNLLGDDEIGDEDDFNAWIRAQDGSFQGINALIDGPVELVAENEPEVSPDGTQPDVPPAVFKPSDSEGSGGTSGSTSFESGTDWDQRLAEHTAEVDGLKNGMERAHAAATASEAARQAATAEAEALRVSYEARLEKLNQQVAQLMQSPLRGTPMLHSGALYGAQAGTPSTLPTMRASHSAPPAAHANPALARPYDDRLSPGLVAHTFHGDARMALVPAPAALIAQVGGGAPGDLAPAPTVQERGGGSSYARASTVEELIAHA